jgi:hypothetical protein
MRQAIRKARGHDKILEYFLPYNKGLSTRTGGSISSACSLPQLRISTFLERYQSDQIDSSTGLPFRAQHYCRLQFPPLPLQHWPVRRTMKNPLAKNPEKLGYRGTCTVPHSMYHASGVIVNHTDCAQNPKSLFRVDSHTNRLFELRHATTHLQKA